MDLVVVDSMTRIKAKLNTWILHDSGIKHQALFSNPTCFIKHNYVSK